ncbi:MAG: HK97 family phage prohead protease [Elusimicrobiaceae bacterium]|nr:HK97 family phage prohead protease [Elusimicrobiaceae bacterium]
MIRVEIRADNTAMITGYVNVTGRESRVLQDVKNGKFIELVKPGTFKHALEKRDNVGLMFNHQKPLGSTKDNLELYEDNIGLYARALVSDPDVIEQAKAKKLSGWSFSFKKEKDSWETRDDGIPRRILEDIDLFEVSILDVTPAYIATSIEMRSDGGQDLVEYRKHEDDITVIDNRSNPDHKPVTDPAAALAQQKRKFEFSILK